MNHPDQGEPVRVIQIWEFCCDLRSTTMPRMSTKKAGERLRAARLAAKLSQQALADLAGVTRMTVVRLEKEYQEGVNLTTLRKLATALGLRLADIADVESSPIEPLVASYLSSPYAQIDQPTDEEVAWLESLPTAIWDGIAPGPAAFHDLVQLHRKFPKAR